MGDVEGHLLDEAHLRAVVEGERDEIGELVVVDPAHRDRVELEGAQPRRGSRGDTPEDVVEPVATGERTKAVGAQRVELMLSRPNPAATSAGSTSSSPMPLVVIAISQGPSAPRMAASRRTTSTRSRLSKGSPPVSRNVVTPAAAATRATSSISSTVRMPWRASHVFPCSGMQ